MEIMDQSRKGNIVNIKDNFYFDLYKKLNLLIEEKRQRK
jgi:hypothetical protein